MEAGAAVVEEGDEEEEEWEGVGITGGGGVGAVFTPTPTHTRDWRRRRRKWEKRWTRSCGAENKENEEGEAGGSWHEHETSDGKEYNDDYGGSRRSGGERRRAGSRSAGPSLSAECTRPLRPMEVSEVGARRVGFDLGGKRAMLVAMLARLDVLAARLQEHIALAQANARLRRNAAGIVASAVVGFHHHNEASLLRMCRAAATARTSAPATHTGEGDAELQQCGAAWKRRHVLAVVRHGPFSYRWDVTLSIVGLL